MRHDLGMVLGRFSVSTRNGVVVVNTADAFNVRAIHGLLPTEVGCSGLSPGLSRNREGLGHGPIKNGPYSLIAVHNVVLGGVCHIIDD